MLVLRISRRSLRSLLEMRFFSRCADLLRVLGAAAGGVPAVALDVDPDVDGAIPVEGVRLQVVRGDQPRAAECTPVAIGGLEVSGKTRR